ncbi:MAG: hypothetical protein KGJ88_12570 [Verrucomicrobiota bacterium]|nr:hypothetical protein [Verrucomicrobiota bacterium]
MKTARAKVFLPPLVALLLFTGCASQPDFATFIHSTEISFARQDCISGARLIELGRNPDSPDTNNLARWVRRKQQEQTNADPVIAGFGQMGVESDVTVRRDRSLALTPQASWVVTALSFGRTAQNENKLNIAALNVVALSDMPDELFNDRIALLESNRMELLKLLAAETAPTNVVPVLQQEFNTATQKWNAEKRAKRNLQNWIMQRIESYPEPSPIPVHPVHPVQAMSLKFPLNFKD